MFSTHCGMDFRRAGNLEEIHADTGGIEAHRLEHGVFEHQAEAGLRQFLAVDVGHVGAEDEGRLETSREVLEMPGLPGGELDGIRRGIDEGLDHLAHVFDAGQEAGLVEEAVIDGDIEAAAGVGVEEAVEAIGFHDGKGGRRELLHAHEVFQNVELERLVVAGVPILPDEGVIGGAEFFHEVKEDFAAAGEVRGDGRSRAGCAWLSRRGR